MKHLLSTALLCGMAVLSSNAQNIVVVDKDNVSHRYNADYVQDITFVKDGGDVQVTELNFESLSVQNWSLTNIALHFGTGNDETKVDLDIYQPRGYWLAAGQYKVDPSYADFTIDPGYTTIIIDGTTLNLASGNMTVTANGEVYTFDMDLLTEEGREIKATYTGTLDKFGPTYSAELVNAAYQTVNDPAANGFYYKFNDADWDCSVRLDFFSDADQLPNGTYTFSADGANGTVSTATSYIDLGSPYYLNSVRFTEGTVTVSGEGDNRVVKIAGKIAEGLAIDLEFTGTLPERKADEPITPTFTFNATEVSASTIWGITNPYLTFKSTAERENVVMDLHQPGTSYLLPGTYEILSTEGGEPTTDYFVTGVGSYYQQGGTQYNFNGGTLNVTLEGKVYTFDGNIILENGNALKFTYTGEIENCGPSISEEPTFDYVIKADTAEEDYYTNNITLNLIDSSNTTQSLMLDIYQEASYCLLPGTYTVATTEAAGTIGSNAQYSFFAEDGTRTGFKSGEVVVAVEGEIYTIDAEITLVNDKTVKATYTGKLPYSPIVNFDFNNAVWVDVNDPAENGFYYRFNDLNWNTETRIDFFAEGTTTLPDGTYTFDNTGANGTAQSSVALYSPYNVNSYFKSGTVTVATQGENRVITIDGYLEQYNLHMTATYTGTLTERKVAEPEPETINFRAVSCNAQAYGMRNLAFKFYNEDETTVLAYDLYHENNWYLQPGTYIIAGTQNGEINKGDATYTYFNDGSGKLTFESGQVVFALDGQIYTMTADIVLSNGANLHATYTGTLTCGPNTQEYELTNAKYVEVNDPAANAYYYRFSDLHSTIEARIDFFAEGGNTLPDGTYTFSASGDNNTANSNVYLGSPFNITSTSFQSGTVTVETVDGQRVITIEGITAEMGIPVKAVFKGTLEDRPASDEPKTYDITYVPTAATKSFLSNKCNVNLTNSTDAKIRISLMPNQSPNITAGTYYIGDDNGALYAPSTGCKYTDEDFNTYPMTSGTIVVTNNDGVYTIVVDAVLENGKTLYSTYIGSF